MYTVLIAEDELLVRIGIASCVPRQKLNLHIIGEAANGQEAWELYQQFHPDLVITDIRMPKMSGLELLRAIRAEDSHCQVIIVTNVEQSESLDEARALGITEVLLKAVMQEEDITAAIIKGCARLPQKTSGNETANEKELWEHYIIGKSTDNKLPYPLYGIVGMRVDASRPLSGRILTSVYELFIHRFVQPSQYCALQTTHGLLLLLKKPQVEEEKILLLSRLVQYIQINFDVNVGFFYWFSANPEEVSPMQFEEYDSLLANSFLYSEPLLPIHADGTYAGKELVEATSKMRMLLPLFPDHQKYLPLLNQLYDYPGKLCREYSEIFSSGQLILRFFQSESGAENLNDLNHDIIRCLQENIFARYQRLPSEMQKVLLFVNEHFDEELSLQKAADLAGYHSVYFSKLFKTELGCNYSDYVSAVRLIRAQQLLYRTKLSIGEIAAICGFDEVSYFCYKFKTFFGETPGRWRNQQ